MKTPSYATSQISFVLTGIPVILVIWKNTEYNIGSAYDESTGEFICPHDGIYSFYATSPIYGTKDLHYGNISIYVNGSQKIRHFLRNSNAGDYVFDHSSPHGVIQLRKGDTVHIDMSGPFYHAGTKCERTYFQGHLIYLL